MKIRQHIAQSNEQQVKDTVLEGVKAGLLIAQLDEMLDRSKPLVDLNVYQKQAIAVRRVVLDEFTKRSLSDHRFNSLYSEIENKVKFRFVQRLENEKSQVEDLVRDYYRPGLLFIKSRVELALQFLRRGEIEQAPVASLEELKHRRSLMQEEAAHLLGIRPRMVRKLVEDGKLAKTQTGRILNDERFRLEYTRRHSPDPK